MLKFSEIKAGLSEAAKGNLEKAKEAVGSTAEKIGSSIFEAKKPSVDFGKSIGELFSETNLITSAKNIADDLKNGKGLKEAIGDDFARTTDAMKEFIESKAGAKESISEELEKNNPFGKLVNFVKGFFN